MVALATVPLLVHLFARTRPPARQFSSVIFLRRVARDTMKARNMSEEEVKRDIMLAAQPTKEFVTVDEVAALALYLTSDAAKAITGALLPIDGGWTAQ